MSKVHADRSLPLRMGRMGCECVCAQPIQDCMHAVGPDVHLPGCTSGGGGL